MTATVPYSPAACPRCGRSLPTDAPAGLCPRCLLSDGFGDRSEPDDRLRTGGEPRFVPPPIEELAAEFPHLEFVRLLGSGGMGAVYLAKQIRLDRPAAVKILPPDLADDPAFAERFLREARALAKLAHPNIVGVYDFGQTPGGLYYFLMEYIEGPTLRQVVLSRTADSKQALEIVRQVCDALQYAHDKGVVHRDIKPENILLDARGRAKIADFGLAKLLGLAERHPGSPAAGSLTGTRQAMGTPHYMAPEQIAGSRGVDHRADIYSLGVVFYELLTGELPLGRFKPPSKKVQLDVRLDEVVLRTLESEPDQRYQRAGDVKTDVETISFVAPRHGGAAAGATAMRFVRDATAGAGRAARTMLQPPGPGELSRKAIFALLWAAAVPAVLLCIVLFETFEHELDVLAALFATIGFVLALPAVTAPVGATVLGVLAVREVRRSDGRITGLVPGLAAALLFPLLLVSFLIVYLIGGITFLLTGEDDEVAVFIAFVFGVPLAICAGLRIVRAAWRKAIEGLPPELIERELSVIPPAVRRAARAIIEWCERMGFSAAALFGGSSWQPAEPDVAEHSIADATPAGPRPSLKAAVGAGWAATLPIGLLLLLFVENTHPNDPVHGLATILLGLFALPALTAPFATTALGWTAVADIRRAAGLLTGLPLAVFDALAFPLLALDVVFGLLVAGGASLIAWLAFGPGRIEPVVVVFVALIAVAIGLGIIGLVDTLIVRAVWRRVKPPLAPEPAGTPPVEPPADATDKAIEPRRNRRDLVAAVVALGVAAGLFGVKAWHDGWLGSGATRPFTTPTAPTAPVPTVSVAPDDAATLAEDLDHRWRPGPNGPELTPAWASNALRIDASTRQAIDAALQDVHAEYERLLDARTEFELGSEAVKFTIEPIEEEVDRLSNRFWGRVDPLLNREQQAIMRYNFPLRYEEPGGGTYALTTPLYEDKVMPFGGPRRFAVQIERSGQWYRWHVLSPHAIPSQLSPELPLWLRHWQHRFDLFSSLRGDGLAIDPQRPPLIAPKPETD